MAFVDYDKFVLFGDSLTEQCYEQTRGFAFGAAFADVYKRKIEVLNRGFGGYNTAHALHVLPKILPPGSQDCSIKLMTIFFGANDAVLPGLVQHVPLPVYMANLKKLVGMIRGCHDPKIIIIVPPPVCEYMCAQDDEMKGKIGPARTAEHTKKYADAALVVGEELNIPTVNLWKAMIDYAGGWQEGQPIPGSREAPCNERLGSLLRDGLHFNPKGYEIMYEEVMKVIVENYPELHPNRLKFAFPPWENAPKVSAEN